MRYRVNIETWVTAEATRYGAEKFLTEELSLSLADTRLLLRSLPSLLPLVYDEAPATTLNKRLSAMGLSASILPIQDGKLSYCAQHPRFIESARCLHCGAVLCVVCQRAQGEACSPCGVKRAKKKRWQKLRVGLLLLVFFFVALAGWREMRRRSLGWDRPQRVAVVLLHSEGHNVPADLVASFAARAADVEEALAAQIRVYQAQVGAPVELKVLGPVAERMAPPSLHSDGLFELLKFNLQLEDYADVHSQAVNLNAGDSDVQIYVRLEDSRGLSEAAEGLSQEGGRIGIVKTAISAQGVDFAWFVVLHEFFHTRGATDKYDAMGRAKNPEGLANPRQVPLFPQPGTEVMARGRPVTSVSEELPGAPGNWVVGPWTAREIGWAAASQIDR